MTTPAKQKQFQIEIQETLSKIITVHADTLGDALTEAQRQYYDAEVVLDSSNYVDAEFIYEDSDAPKPFIPEMEEALGKVRSNEI